MAATILNPRPDVFGLCTGLRFVCLLENQLFYETSRGWELWQIEPSKRVYSFNDRGFLLPVPAYFDHPTYPTLKDFVRANVKRLTYLGDEIKNKMRWKLIIRGKEVRLFKFSHRRIEDDSVEYVSIDDLPQKPWFPSDASTIPIELKRMRRAKVEIVKGKITIDGRYFSFTRNEVIDAEKYEIG